MFKKFLVTILTVAMVTAMWIIPVSAAELVLDEDYGDKEWKGTSEVLVDTLPILADGNYSGNFTLELYVKINDFTTPSVIAGAFAGLAPYAIWVNGGTLYLSAGDTNGNNKVTFDSSYTSAWTGKWLHILGVKNGMTNTLYVFPEGGSDYVTSSVTRAQITVFGNATFFGINCSDLGYDGAGDFALGTVRMYNDDVSADRDAMRAECEARLAAVQPTAVPTAKPTAAPTQEPDETEVFYQVTAENVPVFAAGDTVDMKFSITDIKAAGGLCGLDLILEYNTALLSPNMVYSTEMSGDVLSISSSSALINSSSGNSDCAWWAIGKISSKNTDNPLLILTMLEDNGNYTVSEDGAIWISVSFTAIADSNAGDSLVEVVRARGTDSKLTQVEGKGTSVYAVEVVHEKEEKSLGISQKPTKLTYNIGDTLDLSGMVVSISVNGVIQTVDVNQCVVDGFDSTEAGTCVITVTYETDDAIYKNQFAVKIVDAKGILAIGISVKPTKLRYALGDELDLTGLVVRARCNDGTTIYPDIGDLTVSGYDPTALGVQKVMLTYGGRSNSFSIKVTEYPIPIGIKLISKPSKLIYALGEDLDLTGLSVLAVYSDGTTETLGAEDVTVSGYRNYIIGKQSVIVEYRTVTYSFTVRVDGDFSVYKITLETKPSKLIYSVGEELDLTGLSVKVWYNDDTSVILGPEDLEVSGYDASTTGVQRLTISYQGCSNSFSVRVN